MGTSRPATSRHPLQYFPGLGPDNHQITSKVCRSYNCVAWAAGIENQQLWPSGAEGIMAEPEVAWPEGIRNDETVEALVEYFTTIGYEPCDDPGFEDGYLKIAIFAKDDYPEHVSRQLPSQKWTSKMGFDGVDIEHNDLECIAAGQYGTPTAFMKKPVGSDV